MQYRILAFLLILLAPCAEAGSAATVAAKAQANIDGGNAPGWWEPALPEDIRFEITAKATELAKKLALSESSGAKASALIFEHYARVWAWHQTVDKKLDAAWAEWDEARSNRDGKEKNELKALAIMTERIDPIYAEFAPQIQGLLAALQKEIGKEKTTELLDHITWSPGAKRTYNAYVEMVPQIKDEEKAILWKRMVQAREDSLAAWSGKRIVKIFKKYKVRNEFSIDYFGYGYRKHYEAWVRRKRGSK